MATKHSLRKRITDFKMSTKLSYCFAPQFLSKANINSTTATTYTWNINISVLLRRRETLPWYLESISLIRDTFLCRSKGKDSTKSKYSSTQLAMCSGSQLVVFSILVAIVYVRFVLKNRLITKDKIHLFGQNNPWKTVQTTNKHSSHQRGQYKQITICKRFILLSILFYSVNIPVSQYLTPAWRSSGQFQTLGKSKSYAHASIWEKTPNVYNTVWAAVTFFSYSYCAFHSCSTRDYMSPVYYKVDFWIHSKRPKTLWFKQILSQDPVGKTSTRWQVGFGAGMLVR